MPLGLVKKAENLNFVADLANSNLKYNIINYEFKHHCSCKAGSRHPQCR